MRMGPTLSNCATSLTVIALHRVTTSASMSWLKPLPGRAQGTSTWLILPHDRQWTRGTLAWR